MVLSYWAYFFESYESEIIYQILAELIQNVMFWGPQTS
jgi:hypothetical protein